MMKTFMRLSQINGVYNGADSTRAAGAGGVSAGGKAARS